MQKNTHITMPTLTKLTSDIRGPSVQSKTVLIIIFYISLISANGLAHGSETHDAHTHGVGNLTLAFEHGALEIQFESPAMSLLGFEHKPKTQKQIDTREKTKALLESSTKVISLGGASCSLNRVDVDILGPAGQASGYKQRQEHGQGDHDSDQRHGASDQHSENHSESHSESHSEDHSESHSENHSEVSAFYSFDCADDKQLQFVTVSLFEHFSGLEKLNVSWVTATQQGLVTLRPDSATVELR
jgi:hypothetical protein